MAGRNVTWLATALAARQARAWRDWPGMLAGPALSPVQACNQARRIPAPATHFLHFGIELVDQRSDRQMCAVPACLSETDVKILAHPVDGKAEIELSRRHGLVAVLHLP